MRAKSLNPLPCKDDLPQVRSSRMQALGLIAPGAVSVGVELDGVSVETPVAWLRFPAGGRFALFECPACGRLSQVLRLYQGRIVCGPCDGLYYRSQLTGKANLERLVELLQHKRVTRRDKILFRLKRTLTTRKRRAVNHAVQKTPG